MKLMAMRKYMSQVLNDTYEHSTKILEYFPGNMEQKWLYLDQLLISI